MHNFNSTHLFRAFFLLFFGLMIGDVFGGGIEVILLPQQNGDPFIADSIEGNYDIFHNENDFFFEGNVEVNLDPIEKIVNIQNVSLDVFLIYGSNISSVSSFSTTIISQGSNISLRDKDISIPVNFSYPNVASGFKISIVINNSIQYEYFLHPVVSQSLRKSYPALDNQSKILIEYEGQVIIGFEREQGYEYSYEIIGLNGVSHDRGNIEIGDKKMLKYGIPKNILKNRNQCYIIIIRGETSSGNPLYLWKKFIPFH